MNRPKADIPHGNADAPRSALATALGDMPDGVILVQQDGTIGFCNRQAALLAGVSPDMQTGRPFAEFVAASQINWSLVTEMMDAQHTGSRQLRGTNNTALLASVRRVRDTQSAFVIVLYDLSVFDHARRLASGQREKARFTGSAQRKQRPDFARQRHISPYLDRMISRGERALLQGARVIITGESGVGKTEIARYLHSFVANTSEPFVSVNCAAIPETLFESELFGYDKGAFTGALTEGKTGLIEAAEGGTLFLDEIGEIPLLLQAKLLSFLEDGVITRIGGTRPRRVNVRVISATNRNLLEMAAANKFRLDLYYRLAVVNMPLLPLRETPELMEHLIERFVSAINQSRDKPMRLSADMMQRLMAYQYPGNIRELANLLQQISVLGEEEDDLPRRLANLGTPRAPHGKAGQAGAAPAQGPGHALSLKDAVAEYELRIINDAIRQYGSKRQAAEALGVNIGTIVRKTTKKQ